MKKRLLSILLVACMVVSLLSGFTQPAMAAYSATIHMTLDGQPMSPSAIASNYTTLSAYSSSKYFDFTESPTGTFNRTNIVDGTYTLTFSSYSGDTDIHLILGGNHFLVDTTPFTISNTTSYPLTLEFYSVSYKPGTYATNTGVGWTKIAAKDRGQYTWGSNPYIRDGYKQIGWSTDPGGATKTYDLHAAIYPTSAMTLYPAWGALRPLSITDGAGVSSTKTSATGSVTGSITSGTSAVEGETVTITPGTPDTGYILSAVKYNDGTDHVLTQSDGKYSFTMPAAEVTISAEYVLNTFTVTYKPGTNGIGSQQAATKTKGTALPLKSAIFTRAGYDQTGWATTDGGTKAYELGGSYTTDAATDFYPVWTANAYNISCTLNGGTVSGNPASYTVESNPIALNNPTRDGYTFVGWTGSNGETAQTSVTIAAGSTGNKFYAANWKAEAPSSAPLASIVTAKTDASITITTEAGYEYSVNGTSWYSGAGSYTFTGLTAGTAYDLICRKAAVTTGNTSAASDPSEALSVSTKNGPPSTPTASFLSVTANSVTLLPVTGGEYSKDGGISWQNSNEIAGLSAATQYNFAVRIKETSDTVASAASTIVAQYTAAAVPLAGEGYTIDYSAETISITSGYEVCSDPSFASDKLLSNGVSITPGTTYYVRKAVDTTTTPNTPASANASFTVAARPTEPSSSAYSYDYENEQIIFSDIYEVYTANDGTGSAVTSDSTAITPGGTLYIRVKATSSSPVSEWTTITIPAKPTTTGLSLTANRTDTTITVLAITGAEYSKDGGTTWQSSNEFTGLNPNTDYAINIRYAATDLSFASTPLDSITIKTKTAPDNAPSVPSVSTQTYDSISIDTLSGYQYAITTSSTAPATWDAAETANGSKTFPELSPATQYYVWVRVAETDTAMPSGHISISVYTAAATPGAGVGYTVSYSAETISITSGYEVCSDPSFASDKLLSNGAAVTAGATYYVRVKSSSGVPASEAVSFTVAAKPDAPSTAAYSYDYHDEQIIFSESYEVYTANDGAGSAVTSDITAIMPGSALYIRVKATSAAPASEWTTITIPARPATTGLSLTANRTDTTITVAPITGAEYSKDGGTTWQSSEEFTGLNPNTDYAINIRYAATDLSFASTPLGSITIKTKTAPSTAPSVPSVSTQTYNTITIEAIAGYQYAITTSSTAPTTWEAAETSGGTKIFSGLSAATQYYIWVRVAETDTAMPSNLVSISVHTAAAVPLVGEGYTIDYSAETISIANGYEVSANDDFGTILPSGASVTPGVTYYVRKALNTATIPTTPASAAVSLTLLPRPQTPAATGNAETVDGKNDGKISGVTAAMEWKATGGTYAAVTTAQALNGITGLTDGTYFVRYMAVSGTGFKSAEQEITIAAGHTITVTFNSQSGSDVAGITGKTYGDSATAPADPTRAGFYFAGWYKEASCTNVWTFTFDTLADNITLFAKWSAIPTYTVTGRIVDDASHAVEGATVRIMQGATQYGTTGVTDTNGDFAIDNVPPGTYNLVITQGTKTVVIKVKVSSGNVAIGNAVLPAGNANCVLVVNGSNTPSIVVGGLDSEAGAQLADSGHPHTDNIEITLTVEEKDTSTAANGSAVTDSVTAAGKQVGMILAIDVSKRVNGTEDTSYSQTNEVIEIIIPLPVELQGKATYAVYRHHGASVDAITDTANTDDEKIVIDRTNWTITLFAKKFSTYAISYTNPVFNSSGGSSTSYTITSSAGKTAALPYYIENGKEIFIGFASDTSGTMKYIAPEGATVLFRENPKSFSDIEGHWASGNIDFVTERELFLGTDSGNFSPQAGMTRAMFATVIGRLYERSYGKLFQKDDHAFTDVDYDAYYGAYIDWASENNIITGIGGGLFKPDREISRQEMAVILYRFAKFLNAFPSDLEKTQLDYPDAADISSWATEAAMYCKQTGIITGRSGGYFAPHGTATRAEVAAIMQRFIESSVKLLNDA